MVWNCGLSLFFSDMKTNDLSIFSRTTPVGGAEHPRQRVQKDTCNKHAWVWNMGANFASDRDYQWIKKHTIYQYDT